MSVDGARITANVPTGPIGEVGLKEPSDTILADPFLIPSLNAWHLSSGSTNLSNKIVGSTFALSNPSCISDHA